MHLLVGIDTEGDNQWDAAARANQTFENIYALPRLHALFARHGVRPTYVITHPVATDRAVRRGAAAAAGRRRLRDRRAPPRLGNAAVHAPTTSRRHRTPRRCRAAVRGAARGADRGDRGRRRRAAGVVSVGPLRLLGRSRRGARAARLSGRIERRAALLRSAQGRARVRRGAADAVLPRLRQRHACRAPATCSRCRCRRR